MLLCAVDGVWEDWSLWSRCSVTCGGGIRVRTRNCRGPFDGGQPCIGSAREEQSCNVKYCAGTSALLRHCSAILLTIIYVKPYLYPFFRQRFLRRLPTTAGEGITPRHISSSRAHSDKIPTATPMFSVSSFLVLVATISWDVNVC